MEMDLWSDAPEMLNKILRLNAEYLKSLLELEKAYKEANDESVYNDNVLNVNSVMKLKICANKCKNIFVDLSIMHSKYMSGTIV